ncbi:MAG: dockerin type I domain-containing protein, partial [Planctomycetota bacterium]
AQFGDEFGLPVPGNFDPPITSAQTAANNTNTQLNLDVNNDGIVSSFDALLVINRLNNSSVAPSNSPFIHAPFYDVNGDGDCSALDALLVINALNRTSSESVVSGESEAVPADTVFAELGNEADADDTLMALLSANENDGRKKLGVK